MSKSAGLKELLAKTISQKTRSYSYSIFLFIAMTILIAFAIRPSVVTIFSLQKKEFDLTRVDQAYEALIGRLIDIQSAVEELRDKFYLLSQALPEKPDVNKLIRDVEESSRANSIVLRKVSVSEVNLVQRGNTGLKSLKIDVEASGNFRDVVDFMKDLANQRRLKSISKIAMIRDVKSSTESGQLKVTLNISGYHL